MCVRLTRDLGSDVHRALRAWGAVPVDSQVALAPPLQLTSFGRIATICLTIVPWLILRISAGKAGTWQLFDRPNRKRAEAALSAWTPQSLMVVALRTRGGKETVVALPPIGDAQVAATLHAVLRDHNADAATLVFRRDAETLDPRTRRVAAPSPLVILQVLPCGTHAFLTPARQVYESQKRSHKFVKPSPAPLAGLEVLAETVTSALQGAR